MIDGDVLAGAVIELGSFANGTLSNSRPAVYVAVQNNQWAHLDLRSGTTPVPGGSGHESQTICNVFPDVRPDHAFNLHSYVFYYTAGVDGICNNADDELHAVRLSDSGATGPHSFGTDPNTHVLRTFLNSDGSIAGFVIQVGSELRRYNATLDSFTTLATAVAGFAGNVTFGRTESVIYIRYQDTNSSAYLLKCNLDGTTSTLYSAPHARLGVSTVDDAAIYIAQHTGGVTPAGPDVLMRIPFDPSKPASTIYTASVNGSSIFVVLGTTPNTVVISANFGSTLLAVSKTAAANPVTVATATNNNLGFNEFVGTFVTGDGRIAWTELNGNDSSGHPTASAAGISDEHGTILEQHGNSEWVSPAYGNVSFSTPAATPVLGGVLVRSYTGSYATDGHQGGTIAYYDFTNGVTTDVATVPDQARLAGVYADGIGALTYNVLAPTANSDVAVFDLRNNRFTRVTNTPSVSEQLP